MDKETITLIVSLIGATAWLPQIFHWFKKREILGKIISRYINFNDSETFLLFKIGLLSKNKPFNLKSINCKIIFEDGQEFTSKARNMRKITFNRDEELKVSPNDFLNNYTNLPKDKNITGYLFFAYNTVKEKTRIIKTIFTFTSFENDTYELIFEEINIDDKELFYDDSIWQKIKKQNFLTNHSTTDAVTARDS